MTPHTQPPEQVEGALRTLSLDYAAAVDDRDGERLSQLFVADGELVVPKFPDDLGPVITRAGHQALRRVPQGLSVYERTLHQLSNHRYQVDGDQASGEVQCVAHHLSAAGGRTGAAGPEGSVATDMVWYIRYRDGYRRTDAGWRFVRRELHLQWVEDHPVRALVPAERGTHKGD
jgi:SnoaL-like domain